MYSLLLSLLTKFFATSDHKTIEKLQQWLFNPIIKIATIGYIKGTL